MSEPEPTPETAAALARVLAEAGEVETATDWLVAEARILYDKADAILADPDADLADRERALVIHARLGAAFDELRRIEAEEQR
jgi:hypothetical protein